MRRKDFAIDDIAVIEEFLSRIEFGVLAIPDDLAPYAVPISFCFKDSAIYFHGAKAGRKYELLKREPRVSFSASKPYAYIPSSFLNHTMIPTQFFFSIFIEGKFEVVEDLAKKKAMLEALVQKYEHRDISMEAEQFKNHEKGVFAGVLKVESLSAKAKFGQNMSEKDIESICEDLAKRGERLDFETIKLIRNFRV
ncbi:pyridoxamine 5'-phosphate oxidase family protein [Helicobacter marmotae]|uniref:Antibiotic resistance protein n=1 Tax=Helicobacter marmotae TaxID=152490 RepID=A0A3D8I6K0_9HELI|nr:pyridoxamine 5'-phosphate oxidase family protein [Helicobacter marmotae]RDU60789.1 antibiotic resistance protein [Helicobacter marmotae]